MWQQLQEHKRKQQPGLKTQQKKLKLWLGWKRWQPCLITQEKVMQACFIRYCLVRARTPNLGCSNCVTTSSPSLMEDERF